MNKVLFIGSFLSKTRGTIGISEKLSQSLNCDNIEITLSSTQESKWQRLLEIMYECIVFSGRIVHIDIFSGPAFTIAEIAGTIAKYRKKKIICTLRGGKLPEFYQLNSKRVERLFRKTDRLLTPSLYLRKFFHEKGFNIEYLPNSINLGHFPYAVERCNNAKLLWVRAFSPIYNPSLAIKTLHQLRREFPAATLTMVGPDKGELHKVQALIKELHLESAVEIKGPVPNDALYKYYQSHNVFLNTTAYESFGVAVMEAAACGIPIVSTPAGEISLLWMNEEEILIIPSWSPESMANAVVKILENQELARKLSENAREKAEQYDWQNIKLKWIKLLAEENEYQR